MPSLFFFRAVFVFLVAAFLPQVLFATPIEISSLDELTVISDNLICGKNFLGDRKCFDGKLQAVSLPDTVNSFNSPNDVVGNEFGICGRDGAKISCPLPPRPGYKLRELVASSKPGSLKIVAWNETVCGIDATDGRIHCILENEDLKPLDRREIWIRPRKSIVDYTVSEKEICWTEGDGASCTETDGKPTVRNLKSVGILQLIRADYGMCAKTSTGFECENSMKPPPNSWLAATQVVGGFQKVFCALFGDQHVECHDAETGHAAPSNFMLPSFGAASSGATEISYESNSESQQPRGYRFCVRDAKLNLGCDRGGYYSGINLESHQFSGELKGFAQTTQFNEKCGILMSGQLECASDTAAYVPIPFTSVSPSRPVGVAAFGRDRAFWSGNKFYQQDDVDFNAIEFIGDIDRIATDTWREAGNWSDKTSVCAVTRRVSGDTGIECDGTKLAIDPATIRNPSDLSLSREKACAITMGEIRCWGDEYVGEPRPVQFSLATRVALAPKHACAVDSFGIACWGDMSGSLAVPSDLLGAGIVTDVSVGDSRTCALLADKTVRCWGDLGNTNANAPTLQGVDRIFGSQSTFCAHNAAGLHCWGGENAFSQ